jgi:large subunit ribosomal protein L3
LVKVTGISKGKGFQGVVKRHHFGGGPDTHGQSDRTRAPGSVGASSYPSRVLKGMRMAGRMGNDRVTVRNLRVVRVDSENNIVMVRGAVPGARNGVVLVIK